MRIRDCVADAAFFIGQREEYQILESGITDLGDYKQNIEFLISCANRVISEIAESYLKLREREELDTNDEGEVCFERFSKTPVYIVSATKDEQRISFKEFPDRISTSETGRIVFEYCYVPDYLSLDEEVPFRRGKIDSRIIAYGIASEYYLINGQPDEAIVWDKRYRDGLHIAAATRKESKIRKRLWA